MSTQQCELDGWWGRVGACWCKRTAKNSRQMLTSIHNIGIETEIPSQTKCTYTISTETHTDTLIHIVRIKGIVLLRTVTLMSMYYSKRIVPNYRKWRSTITCRVSKAKRHTDKMSIKYLKLPFTFGSQSVSLSNCYHLENDVPKKLLRKHYRR